MAPECRKPTESNSHGKPRRNNLAAVQERGIETPSTADLIRFDRKRKGKTLSNAEWVSETDPEARITKMKHSRTHLAYKPEHAVDLDTDFILAAKIYPADQGDTSTLPGTLAQAEAMLDRISATPMPQDPAEFVTDNGYCSRDVLTDLADGPWRSRIAEPDRLGLARWHGDAAARWAVYNNRARLLKGGGRPDRLQAARGEG
jgi:transposase